MSDEFVRPSDHLDIKPEISQELAGLDVKATQERPNLNEHKGIEHAGPSVPAPTLTSSQSHLPDEEEAERMLKKTQPTDSFRGFLLLVQRNNRRGGGVKAA